MKRALISVSNKTGLVEFAKTLIENNYEIVSTGGTEVELKNAGIPTINISEITNFPEIMDGRVKTLHPNVHGGLLCVRDNEEHLKILKENNIELIDLVCVNLYPFKETLSKENITHAELIENIDIGGPSMLRSAAKNYQSVTVCVDPNDYQMIANEIINAGDTTFDTRSKLAAKVFRHVAAYDSLIAEYLTNKVEEKFPEVLTLSYELAQDLRYGENPHQAAAFYKNVFSGYSIANANQLHGKELSYNNIQDANAAIDILKEFVDPTVVVVKHMNPCGVGCGKNINDAWDKAYAADPISIFGGIVVTNKTITEEVAKKMSQIFLEVVLAPDFSKEALKILSQKENIRLLKLNIDAKINNNASLVSVNDGLLLQDKDLKTITENDLVRVTKKIPTNEEVLAMLFNWKVVKHVKSNAIVVGNKEQTYGIGAGQMNRVGSAKIALEQAKENSQGLVLASDAFLPMDDVVELANQYGITAIIQTGGSIRDEESIKKCDEYNIAMVFTNVRHFKH